MSRGLRKSVNDATLTGMDMKPWLLRVAPSVNAAAGKIGVTTSTLNTQLSSKGGLRPELVVKIARAYGASPIAALVELGLLKAEEAQDATGLRRGLIQLRAAQVLADASDEELLAEIGRRLDERAELSQESSSLAVAAEHPEEEAGEFNE